MARSDRDRRGHRNRSVDVALARRFGHDRRLVLVFSTRYGLPLDPRTSTTGSRCKQRRRVCRAVGALDKTNVHLVACRARSVHHDRHPFTGRRREHSWGAWATTHRAAIRSCWPTAAVCCCRCLSQDRWRSDESGFDKGK